MPGEADAWPDIMKRWMGGYGKAPVVRPTAPVILFCGVTQSPGDLDFKCPSLAEIAQVQQKQQKIVTKNAEQKDSELLFAREVLWIPEDTVHLKLRLLIIAPSSTAGHCGIDSTCSALRSEFREIDQRKDLCNSVSFCSLCLILKSGKKYCAPWRRHNTQVGRSK